MAMEDEDVNPRSLFFKESEALERANDLVGTKPGVELPSSILCLCMTPCNTCFSVGFFPGWVKFEAGRIFCQI